MISHFQQRFAIGVKLDVDTEIHIERNRAHTQPMRMRKIETQTLRARRFDQPRLAEIVAQKTPLRRRDRHVPGQRRAQKRMAEDVFALMLWKSQAPAMREFFRVEKDLA